MKGYKDGAAGAGIAESYCQVSQGWSILTLKEGLIAHLKKFGSLPESVTEKIFTVSTQDQDPNEEIERLEIQAKYDGIRVEKETQLANQSAEFAEA